MKFDLRAFIVIAAGLTIAAIFGLVPTWVAVVAVIIAGAAIGQHYRTKNEAARLEEHRLLAAYSDLEPYADEIKEMEFVERTSYVLKAAEEFNATSPDEIKAIFKREVAKAQANWQESGLVMPSWFVFALMRKCQVILAEVYAGGHDETNA